MKLSVIFKLCIRHSLQFHYTDLPSTQECVRTHGEIYHGAQWCLNMADLMWTTKWVLWVIYRLTPDSVYTRIDSVL